MLFCAKCPKMVSLNMQVVRSPLIFMYFFITRIFESLITLEIYVDKSISRLKMEPFSVVTSVKGS